MKLYDPKAKCRKCGGGDVSTSYHAEVTSYCNCGVDAGEHICRYCWRCRFQWAEECIKPTAALNDAIYVTMTVGNVTRSLRWDATKKIWEEVSLDNSNKG